MRLHYVLLPPAAGQTIFRRHILHPEKLNTTYCGRKVSPLAGDDDRFLRGCGICNTRLVRHREDKRKAKLPPPPPPRGGSIRTVSGGLPGLGRR